MSPDGGQPDPQQPQPYGQQPFPGQQYPQQPQPYGQQLYPGQQYPQQPYPGQQYPQQPYPGQQYPQQPYPGQQYPQQPYPGQQYAPAPPQLYAAPRPEPLPVEPKQYHQFYRAPAFRWWKPLVALLAFAVGWFLASLVAIGIALAWDTTVNGVQLDPGNLNLNTPAIFAANNVSLAACIPVAMLVSWLVYRQRPGFLSSITGRFRWGLFGHFLLIVAPLMLAWMAIQTVLSGGLSGLAWGPNSLFLLVTILLTTPLQAAGEEYANRGLIARSVGSWFGNRWIALAAATLVNGVVFTLLHAAAEPWLNAYYFTVAVTFTLLTWRTGGLEAAIVMHIVNNLLGELTLPFSTEEFSHLFDRQAGTAGPEVLIQIGVTLLVGAVLWWRAGKLRLPQVAAPGAAQPSPPPGPVFP